MAQIKTEMNLIFTEIYALIYIDTKHTHFYRAHARKSSSTVFCVQVGAAVDVCDYSFCVCVCVFVFV